MHATREDDGSSSRGRGVSRNVGTFAARRSRGVNMMTMIAVVVHGHRRPLIDGAAIVVIVVANAASKNVSPR